jgi:hypothetical protein
MFGSKDVIVLLLIYSVFDSQQSSLNILFFHIFFRKIFKYKHIVIIQTQFGIYKIFVYMRSFPSMTGSSMIYLVGDFKLAGEKTFFGGVVKSDL